MNQYCTMYFYLSQQPQNILTQRFFCKIRFMVLRIKEVLAFSKISIEEQLGLFLINSKTTLFLSSFMLQNTYSAQKYK